MNEAITHNIDLPEYDPAEPHRIATDRTEFVIFDTRCTVVTEITKAQCISCSHGKTWQFTVQAIIK